MLVDDLDVFLRNRRRSVKNDRESGKSSGNLFQNIQTKLRLGAGLELVSAVRGSDCDSQRINAGLLHKLFNLFRMRIECLIRLYRNSVFLSCQSSKFSLYNNAALMSIFSNLSGNLNVLLERMAGVVDHNGSKSVVDAILAGLKICTVIQMKNDRKLRVKLCCCLNKLDKVYGIRILSCALGSLKNNGALQLCCCVRDSLNDFHVVDVESSDCVAAVISLLKQFCTSNDRHIKYHLSLK